MAPINLNSKTIDGILTEADTRAKEQGDQLVQDLAEWAGTLRSLFQPDCPLTYLPVLGITLVARVASPDVNVKRIQSGDEYSAALVGQRLVEYGRENEVDVRTDSSNVMNSQPFVRQPEITATLSTKPQYKDFYNAVERVQQLTADAAARVLALLLHLGRENWPHRKRRKQKNLIHLPHTEDTEDFYFILNQSPLEDFKHYDGEDHYGFHENVTSAKALVEAGGGRFVFYRTSDAKDAPMSFVGSGTVTRVDQQPDDDEGRQTFHAEIGEFTAFKSPVPKVDGAPAGWNSQNSITRISKQAFDHLLQLGTGQSPIIEPMSLEDLRAECETNGLLLPSRVLASLLGALESGKHVVLTGPPGTAKTTLALMVSNLATKRGQSDGTLLTTATSDWSTYDTIGGLSPRSDGTLAFRHGRFLDALSSNRWLVVDELNRSNFDRAFGQLFTVIAGADVVLPFEDPHSGKPIRIRHSASAEDNDFCDVVVEPGWRMIATINNFDKSLLFEMSFALMRRFAFVEVPVPTDEQYLELAGRIVVDDAEDVSKLVRSVITALMPVRRVKEVGPAVFIDAARMARKMALGSELTGPEIALQVFYAMLLPQFEGIEEPEGKVLLAALRSAVGTSLADDAQRMLQEVLGLELGKSASTLGRSETEQPPSGQGGQ